MNRTDIIQRFRDRITQGERTRLFNDELMALVQCFIDRLKPLDDRDQIDQLCTEELALLEEGYSKATIAKNYVRHYRDAIEKATTDGTLPLTETTLLDYDYDKRSGETVHFHGHYAYRAMKYDNQQYTAIAIQDNTRNNDKQDHLKAVQLDRYLEKARELLASSDHNELAVGIAAVTGRRFSEVIQNKFSRTDSHYQLRFAGQLKKHEAPDAYNTLCLIEAADVWKAIQRFRKLDRIQELQNLTPQQINARMNKSVQRVADLQFGETANAERGTSIVPKLEGETATTIHNLRAVYAIAAIHYFCPPTRGDHRFLQEQLGHIIGQSNLQQLKNSSSTAHYFHYYLVDADGNHISEKGVLLNAQTPEPEFVQPQLPSHSEASTPTKMALQSTSKDIANTSPETKFMDALTELSNTIGYLRNEAQEHKQNAERLQADRDALKLEVEILLNRVKELEQAKQTQGEQVEPLKQQIERLQVENAAYRARLEKLEGFARSIIGVEQETAVTFAGAEGIAEVETSTSTAAPASTLQPVIRIESNNYPTAAPKKLQKSRAPGRRSARSKLEGAVKFIQDRNRDLEHDQQWAITQSLIASLTGSNIANTVKPFWTDIKAEMEKYNHDLAMDDRANYGRAGEIPQLKDEFESWLNAQMQPQ